MIAYLVTQLHAYTMEIFLDTWGASLSDRIAIVHYERLARLTGSLHEHTCVFSDLDRLDDEQLHQAGALADAILERGGKIFNHPAEVVGRVALLKLLYERGINSYQIQMVDEGAVASFPVFLRSSRGHEGALSDLLWDQDSVDRAILRARLRGYRRRHLMIAEFRSARGADGIYRKHSVFVVGDQIVPRHEIFAEHWMLKEPDLIDPDKVAEERAFLDANPHEDLLRQAARLARVDYGRIDYGVADGRPEIWEINTNPIVMLPPRVYEPAHVPAQKFFLERITAAFESIDTRDRTSSPLRPSRPPMARILRVRRVGSYLLTRALRACGGAVGRVLALLPRSLLQSVLRSRR